MTINELVLPIVKARLGFSRDGRDEYLSAIINGVVDEMLNVYGAVLDPGRFDHISFAADFASWRYLIVKFTEKREFHAVRTPVSQRARNLRVGGVRAVENRENEQARFTILNRPHYNKDDLTGADMPKHLRLRLNNIWVAASIAPGGGAAEGGAL